MQNIHQRFFMIFRVYLICKFIDVLCNFSMNIIVSFFSHVNPMYMYPLYTKIDILYVSSKWTFLICTCFNADPTWMSLTSQHLIRLSKCHTKDLSTMYLQNIPSIPFKKCLALQYFNILIYILLFFYYLIKKYTIKRIVYSSFYKTVLYFPYLDKNKFVKNCHCNLSNQLNLLKWFLDFLYVHLICYHLGKYTFLGPFNINLVQQQFWKLRK